MTETSKSSNFNYMHIDSTELNAFMTKVRTFAKAKSADCLKVHTYATKNIAHNLNDGDFNDANSDLADIIITHTGNKDLLDTLSADTYLDNGVEIIKYLRSCHSAGGNEGKQTAASNKYNDTLKGIDSTTSTEDLTKIFNKLTTCRNDLRGSNRFITDGLYISDITDAVKAISHEHKMEVKDAIKDLDPPDRDRPAKVQLALEGVVASLKTDKDGLAKETARKALAAKSAGTSPTPTTLDSELLKALLADRNTKRGTGQGILPQCDDCGVRHPVGPDKPCHAKLLADGKEVPGWDQKAADQKQRIQSRADDIKRLGRYVDRKTKGVGNVKAGPSTTQALLTLLGTLPGGHMSPITRSLTPSAVSLVNTTRSTYGATAPSRLIVDTGNLTGKHLICDKTLFSSLDNTSPAVPFSVANDNIEYTSGSGPCDLLIHNSSSADPVGRVVLGDCAYAPSLGVNLLSVQQAQAQGAKFDLDSRTVTLANGTVIPFDHDFTMHITATPSTIAHLGANATAITRGKDGTTHISVKSLPAQDQAKLDLWSARLGSPTAEVMRTLHRVADGVPDILQKADRHNALSMPRLLADGASMPTRKRDAPIASRPGQISSFDHWHGPCAGYLGYTGMIAGIDNYSGHFRLYPCVSKGEAPACINRYYRDAAHDGVHVQPGSTLYTDNEQIFNSRSIESVVVSNDLTHEFSAEYEPWGNGGIESVFRYVPAYMRRCHIQSNAPEELWPFSALDAEHVLNITRSRDGTSCRELWCGKRGNVSRRRVLFCKMIARKPVSWRGSKLDARCVEGVYCGKARNKQGFYCLTEEYGLVCSTNVTWIETEFPFKNGFTYRRPTTGGHTSGLRVPQPAGGGGGGGGGGAPPPAADDGDSDDDDDSGLGHDYDGDASSHGSEDADDDGDDAAYVPSETSESGQVHHSPSGTRSDPSSPAAPDESSANPESTNSQPCTSPSSDSNTDSSDPPAPGSRPAHRLRSAVDLTNQSLAETFGGDGQARNAETGRLMHTGPVDELVARIGTSYAAEEAAITPRRQQYLDAMLAAACVRVQELVLHGIIPLEHANLCASAAPGGQDPEPYIPQPRDNLDDLDEAVQAVWRGADDKEIAGILKWAKVIKIKDVPKGTKIIGSTVQRKFKRDGTPKTRVCVQGFNMIAGLHYDRTHSPCIAHCSTRCLLSIAACLDACVDFVDFTQAYTQSELDPSEYIFMRPPPGHRTDADDDEVCWLITQSLYGMKQSGRNWFLRLRKWLLDEGFTQGFADPCTFTKKTGNGTIILGVYVDDMIIVHTDAEARDALVSKMSAEFNFTDQGKLTDVLGMQIKQTADSITITHSNYIDGLAKTFLDGEANRKEHKTPAAKELPDLVAAATDSSETPDAETLASYRSLVGSLLYCAVTVRPDISYAVGMLSRALNKPNKRLLDEAKRVLTYLVLTKDLGLRYMRNAPVRLYGMTDSDWTTRRSTSGFAFFLGGAAIAYLSKKQPTIALSSTEAEIMAASLGALEAVYLRVLLSDLGLEVDLPTELYVDNSGAIDWAHDYVTTDRTKHIERRHFKIRELVEEATIRVKFVASSDNIADIFTKPLEKKEFLKLRAKLLNEVRGS